VRQFVKLAVTSVIVYLILTKVDLSEVWMLIRKAVIGWVFLSVGLFLFSKYLASFRLRLFLRAGGVPLTQRFNWRLYLLGMYYNLFLPGSVGGDGYKILELSRRFGYRKRDLVLSMLLDRLSGVLALGVLLLVALGLPEGQALYQDALPVSWVQAAPYLLVGGIVAAYVVSAVALRQFAPAYWGVLWPTHGWSLLVQVTQVGAALCLLYGLHTFHSEVPYMVLFLVSSVAAVVPLTFGGLGSREFVFTVGASQLGTREDVGLTLGLMFYLVTVVSSLVGIYFSYRPERMTGPNSNGLEDPQP